MVSPDSQGTACPPSGRNSTYRPVQISGTGSLIFQYRGVFSSEIGAYQDYHNATTDLRVRRGIFRDFHFAYARAIDKKGRPIVCIDTDSLRDGNLNKYSFADLKNARLPSGNPGLFASLFQSLVSPVFASQPAKDGKYVYDNLQSQNIWFAHRDTDSVVEFTLHPSIPLQIISLSNIEARTAPLLTQYFLIKWR
jgi:hypothetical protein